MGIALFRFLSDVIDLFTRYWFSPCCPICQKCLTSRSLCVSCSPISPITGALCDRCGIQVDENRTQCADCEELKDDPINRIRSSLWFTDEAKVIMHLIKFQNRFEWLEIFREHLRDFPFLGSGSDFVCIPVPIHRKKYITRGFNQSEIILEWTAERWLLKNSGGLEKVKETVPQSSLNKQERKSNLDSSFRWNPRFEIPEKVILIDDIFTTGETLKACARVLKEQGAKEIYGWTLFRAKPLRESSLKGFSNLINSIPGN